MQGGNRLRMVVCEARTAAGDRELKTRSRAEEHLICGEDAEIPPHAKILFGVTELSLSCDPDEPRRHVYRFLLGEREYLKPPLAVPTSRLETQVGKKDSPLSPLGPTIIISRHTKIAQRRLKRLIIIPQGKTLF